MDLATCTLRHRGKLTCTIRKKNVTPAEMILLRAIHGADAVVDAELVAEQSRSSAEEMERLRHIYGVSAENLKLIDSLFPGHSPRLPVTFAEADLEVSIPGVRAPSGKKAKAPAADDALSALE